MIETVTPSPDLAILRFLGARTYATAAEIGITCRMTAAEVRARLVLLESMRLVAGRRDPDASRTAPQRVYVVTGEGRRKAGISDARGPTDAAARHVNKAVSAASPTLNR